MSGGSRFTLSRGAAAAAAVALVLVGAGTAYLVIRARERAPTTPAAAQTTTAPAQSSPSRPFSAGDATPPDIVVPLTPEAAGRAGIVVEPVGTALLESTVRLPGLVQPNGYRQVTVTPLVAGRVTAVAVQLGDHVRKGQRMAQIYSPELADAQTRYVSARAMLDAHDRELQRTEKLVEIGAASRQELERIHAEHAAQTAEVEAARSRLELLGIQAQAIAELAAGRDVSAESAVPAPIEGEVTERTANVGLNVDPSTKLFTVVDMSTVWVVGELYERDFPSVRVGSEAAITTAAYPDLRLRGRVSYIDPQLNPETRTASVRVEVANPRGALRLGMYADVLVSGDGAPVVSIPRSAIQNVGSRAVVYLANPAQRGTYLERTIRVGRAANEDVEVLSGVTPGDRIVTKGSFSVRAERERLGLGEPAAAAPAREGGEPVHATTIIVSERGFEPAQVRVAAGVLTRITFLRTTEKTCGTEVVFPSLGVRRALPLNEPVAIEFTPARGREVAFTCGMQMLHGTVLVQ